MAMFRKAFAFLFFTMVARGFPTADSVTNLPSMLAIASEEELGLYSKKWNMTPVQMCTLMGHQMTIAQPLLDINHPLVSHLPTIGEMAMSDAVMICEKVLNDAKGRTATVTTVVEETRQEYSVPRDFLFNDDDFLDFADDMMDAVGFSSADMREAMEDNTEALIELLETQYGEESKQEEVEVVEEPPAPTPPPTPTMAETLKRLHT